MNPFIAICVRQKSRAAAQKILAGARLLCGSAAAVSCQKHTPLLSDWSRNTAAIQHHSKTYGARNLDRVLICSSSPNFPDDYLYRFGVEPAVLVKPDSP